MTSLILVLTLAAPTVAPAEASPRDKRPKGCAVLEVQPSHLSRQSRQRAWKAREVVDLEFRGALTTALPSKRVELRVLTPGGHLYQTLAVATVPAGREAAPGVTRAPVQRFVAKLPISGTSVTERGLFGRWTVVPHFPGEADPCGGAVTFELLP